jgi:hypothetical protein
MGQIPVHSWKFFGGVDGEFEPHLKDLPELGEFLVIGPAAQRERKGRFPALDLQTWLSAERLNLEIDILGLYGSA